MKIGLLQMNSGNDIALNIARFQELAARAAAQGAQLVASPENTFLMSGESRPLPNPPPQAGEGIKRWTQAAHPGMQAASETAKKHGVWLLLGSVAVLPDPSLRGSEATAAIQCDAKEWIASSPEAPHNDAVKTYNRSVLFAPDGAVAAHYDKIHLFDVEVGDGQTYKESARILPGDRSVVATINTSPSRGEVAEPSEAGGGELQAKPTPSLTLPPLGGGNISIGMTICYDLRFPQLYRALAKAGAQILAVPAAFTQVTGEAHWHTLLRARAIENGCFVIAPGQTGTHPGSRKTYGHSLIIDPWGRVLADGGTEEGIVMAEIDLSEVDKARGRIPSLAHDREFNSQ